MPELLGIYFFERATQECLRRRGRVLIEFGARFGNGYGYDD